MILVDLNVVLDVVQQREPHYRASAAVLEEVTHGRVDASLPAHAFTTLHYLVARYSERKGLRFLAGGSPDPGGVSHRRAGGEVRLTGFVVPASERPRMHYQIWNKVHYAVIIASRESIAAAKGVVNLVTYAIYPAVSL